jgi:hypothetical protein
VVKYEIYHNPFKQSIVVKYAGGSAEKAPPKGYKIL